MPDMESETPFVAFELTGRGFGKTAAAAERAKGYRADQAYVDEVSAQPERTPADFVERAEALPWVAPEDQPDEVSAQTEQILTGPKKLRMRRSGRGPSGMEVTATVDGKRTTIPACPHMETRTRQVPHPKYGDKVAHFETYLVRPGPHECVSVLQ